jgi:hypothetical protein
MKIAFSFKQQHPSLDTKQLVDIQNQISDSADKWNRAALVLVTESDKSPSQRRLFSKIVKGELVSSATRYKLDQSHCTEFWNNYALTGHVLNQDELTARITAR